MTENTEKITEHRFGFLSLVGRANVGKSTLLNCLIGKPLSAVSTKAQTTRKNFRGIMTTKDYQAIFIDTPGMHAQPAFSFGRYLPMKVLRCFCFLRRSEG